MFDMSSKILPTIPICVICDKIIINKHSCRYTTIGLVCDTCFPTYDKINKLLCKKHTKSLNVALSSVSQIFDNKIR